MEQSEIQELLAPYVELSDAVEHDSAAVNALLHNISIYIDILMRWNQRTNLTGIREEHAIVQRHFGESLFAAHLLLVRESTEEVLDLGSGAGFPGLPLKLWAHEIKLRLVESQNKKATFLREVVRALGLAGVEVVNARGESLQRRAKLVTMRAVEDFERALPVAAALCAGDGRLGVLIGSAQVERAQALLDGFRCQVAAIPGGDSRVVLVAERV